MCPNASIMPSLARMRLATASSWRSSAKASGMAGFFPSGVAANWRVGDEPIESSESRTAIESLAIRHSLSRHHHSQGRVFVSGASDLAEEIGEFLLDLLPQLRARPCDHGKIRKSLEWPTGIDDRARIGRARLVEQRIERPAPGAAHKLDVACGIAARAHRPHQVEQVGR